MYSSWLGKSELRWAIGISSLVALALWLRLWGLAFGMPLWSNFYIRPDETLLVVSAVEIFARHGYPGHLDYPALMIQGLGVWFQIVHAVFSLLGSAHASILDDFGADPSRYFLAGRAVSAFCGSACVMVTFCLAKRWCSDLTATITAAWYAVSTLAVREAHFAVTDTALSLLVAGTVLAAIRYFEASALQRRKAMIWCGCLCGMSLAIKYVAGILIPALLFAFLAAGNGARRPDRLRMALLFLALAAGLFCVLNPWLLVHPGAFLDWMYRIFQAVYHHRPQTMAGVPDSHGWQRAAVYFGFLPGRWIGLVFAIVGLASGLLRCQRDRSGQLIGFLAVTLAYAAMLSPAGTLPFRYLAPLLPLVAVLAGIGLETSMHSLERRPRGWALMTAGLLGIATTLPTTIRMDRSLVQEDTRSEAGRWIKEHVPATVPIVWLGEPESEPQWQESAASIQRRIQYVEQRYGLTAARVIDRPYRLLMHAPQALASSAHEIYRNPTPEEALPQARCVVQADYPLPMVASDQEALRFWTKGQLSAQKVIGPALDGGRNILDHSDAWFLPMNLSKAMQPGPRLTIYLTERKGK
jgi:hypothetical protein